MRVFVHGRLFARRDDGGEDELLPLGESHFYLWVNAYEVEFQRDAEGVARSVRLITPRGTVSGARLE